MKVAYSAEAGLIAKYRIPLDGKMATMLAAHLIQNPEHTLEVEPPFLVVRHA